MPGYERAEVSAELTVVTSERAEKPPREQVEAAKTAAGKTGLAREAGPETLVLAGSRREVLEATTKVVEASLVAGAQGLEVKVKSEQHALGFDASGGEAKRKALVDMLRRVTPDMRKTLEAKKEEGLRWSKRSDLIWFLILMSFATWGNSRGWALIDNQRYYRRVAFDELAELTPSERRKAISAVLWDAGVRMPDKKAELLNRNFGRIVEMGGLREAKKQAQARKGIDAKIAFMQRFDGIGDKYARNVWMDIYHEDFRNSIAVDARIKKVTRALGYTFKDSDYAEHERFYQKIAEEAGLEGWELDRLLYTYRDTFLERLRGT